VSSHAPSPVALKGLVFRVTSPRYRDLHRTAEITKRAESHGRFNTAEFGAVYVSREPGTACQELRRRLARAGADLDRVHPRSIFVLDVHLHAVADIRTAKSLALWGLTADDVNADDMGHCQAMAAVATQLGYEAVRWNAATGEGESLALYVGQLRPDSQVRIAAEHPLTREMLSEMQRGTQVAALIPELLDYSLLL
jgi:RES domain-containing protein